jgi:hypothetical protein
MSLRIQSVCIDTTDPAGLATFWERALGWRRTFDEPDEVVLEHWLETEGRFRGHPDGYVNC